MNAIRLRQLILDAAEHVPFYRQHWREAGVDLTRIASAVHLEFLPVVRKADLLACPPEMRLDARFLDRPMRGEPTSGSTGRPFEMPIDRQSLGRRRWRFARALMHVGYVPGQRLMLITDPPFPTGAAFARWTYADLRRGEEQVFATYVRTRPNVLYGSLSSLVLLARRMLASPEVTCRPKLVISTAEQLTDAHRALLESAFGARVSDFYGMTELGLVAYSVPGRSGYELVEQDFHFELLPAGNRTDLERLVVTDLGGGAMPLIRFDTGDLVRRDRARRGAPIVQVSGRQVDCLKLANGAWLSPYEVTLALDRVAGIRQYQVVQHNDLSVDLYVAPGDAPASSVLDKARQVLAGVCGGVMSINVHELAEQPVRFGEKQRVVCSHAMA